MLTGPPVKVSGMQHHQSDPLTRVWSYTEDDLRNALRVVGVEDVERWSCPCSLPTCFTFVLYGVGINPETGSTCIWVALSATYVDDGHPFMFSPETIDEVDDVPVKVPRELGGGLLAILLANGLDTVLKDAVRAAALT